MAKILIIKLGALGDVVMATALVDAIVRHHADDSVELLTTPPYAPLFAAWSALAVSALPRSDWRAVLRLVRHVRRGRYARIYDLQGNDVSALCCALSGAPERIGNHCRYPYTHHPPTPWAGQGHIFARLCEVLASAGIVGVAARPRLPASGADIAHVDAWCEAHGLGHGRFVLLHAGASAARPEKIWPHFAGLAARLAAHGLPVVWLGGTADAARNAALADAVGIDASGAFSVPALARLGTRARFAVTNDSGPMHVLSAAGIPVFALFGPSDWRRNHALGQAARVIACTDHAPAAAGARTGNCLDSITVEHVWARLAAEALV